MLNYTIEPENNYEILHAIIDNANVFYLLVNNQNRIIEQNNYSVEKAGGLVNKNLTDVFYNVAEDFSLHSFVSKKQAIMLSINGLDNLPISLNFNFFKRNENVVVVGLPTSSEEELLQREIIALNNDLTVQSRQLQKKNAELKKLNDIKDQFIGMASHDIRSPLGNIKNFSEYLIDDLKSQLNEIQLKFLQHIKKSSEFGLSLLNEILEISRIENGTLKLKLEQININDCIHEAILMNEFCASKKQIDIHYKRLHGNSLVFVDYYAVLQIFNNLISNAVKYSFPNTKVEIGLEECLNEFIVHVTDQGQGIPENEHEKVFQPFNKISVKPTGDEKSTGLGLAIVKKLVNDLHGRIWFESKPNQGSTFYVSLPKPKYNK